MSTTRAGGENLRRLNERIREALAEQFLMSPDSSEADSWGLTVGDLRLIAELLQDYEIMCGYENEREGAVTSGCVTDAAGAGA